MDHGGYLELIYEAENKKQKKEKISFDLSEDLGDLEIQPVGEYYQVENTKFISNLVFFVICGGEVTEQLCTTLNTISRFFDKKDNLFLSMFNFLVKPSGRIKYTAGGSSPDSFTVLPELDYIIYGNIKQTEMVFDVLNTVALYYAAAGNITTLFSNRIDTGGSNTKIFVNNETLFTCIGTHYSCDNCRQNRYRIRNIFRGTLLEVLCNENIYQYIATTTGKSKTKHIDFPISYPFLYDFLVLTTGIDNRKFDNPRETNLFIDNISVFLHKENLFVIDLLINSYGLKLVSKNRHFLDNASAISDRFITLLLLNNNFDTSILDVITQEFGLDLEFIFCMLTSKFNLDKETFAYASVKDCVRALYTCLDYVYGRIQSVEERQKFINRVCFTFGDNVSDPVWKWKLLDIVMILQENLPTNRLVIPILYEEEPEGGYWIGKYLGRKRGSTPLRYDIIKNKTFVFNSTLNKADENKRVVDIYRSITSGNHPYFSLEKTDFNLSYDISSRSNLVFHIYCEVKR